MPAIYWPSFHGYFDDQFHIIVLLVIWGVFFQSSINDNIFIIITQRSKLKERLNDPTGLEAATTLLGNLTEPKK